MLYMPNPYNGLVGNILEANWSSLVVNRFFFLEKSFLDMLINIPWYSWHNLEEKLLSVGILEFSTEIDKKTGDNEMYAELFSLFAWRFFDVDPDIDIDKPRWYWLDIQR